MITCHYMVTCHHMDTCHPGGGLMSLPGGLMSSHGHMSPGGRSHVTIRINGLMSQPGGLMSLQYVHHFLYCFYKKLIHSPSISLISLLLIRHETHSVTCPIHSVPSVANASMPPIANTFAALSSPAPSPHAAHATSPSYAANILPLLSASSAILYSLILNFNTLTFLSPSSNTLSPSIYKTSFSPFQ